MQTYDQYSDPNCPPCDCADWGMMGCLSTCSQDKYIKRKQQEIKMSNQTASDLKQLTSLPAHQGYILAYKREQMVAEGGQIYDRVRWTVISNTSGEVHTDIHGALKLLHGRGWVIRPQILLEKLLPPPSVFYPRDIMNHNGISPGNTPRELHLWSVDRLQQWYLEVEAKAKEDARIMIEESQAVAVVEESKADETPAAKDWQEEPPPVRYVNPLPDTTHIYEEFELNAFYGEKTDKISIIHFVGPMHLTHLIRISCTDKTGKGYSIDLLPKQIKQILPLLERAAAVCSE